MKTHEMLKIWKVVFNGALVKKSPCQHQDSNPRPCDPRLICSSHSLLMVIGLLLSHHVGPKLVASTLGDLEAVASKLLWHRPDLSQGLYIQLSSRPSAWLTSFRNGARLAFGLLHLDSMSLISFQLVRILFNLRMRSRGAAKSTRSDPSETPEKLDREVKPENPENRDIPEGPEFRFVHVSYD